MPIPQESAEPVTPAPANAKVGSFVSLTLPSTFLFVFDWSYFVECFAQPVEDVFY